MKDVVGSWHSGAATLEAADIADVEFDLVGYFRVFGLILVAHIVLLFLVAGENADFFNVCLEETVKDCVSEATGTAGNH